MKRKANTFYCFSPPVMMATFLIESILAVYVAVRYRMSTLTRISVALLACLATFQLAEYYVCGGIGVDAATWSKVGYAAITLLPPLGLHASQAVAGRKLDRLSVFAYGTAAIWVAMFLLTEFVFNGAVCGGNYVIFKLKPPLGGMFFAYYYIWLFTTMFVAIRNSRSAKPKIRKALTSMVFGYMMFIVPTTIVNLLYPDTFNGVPSIMCGFAVLFAITLTMGVMPVEKLRSRDAILKHD